jgi:hypothetical protein
MRPPRFTQSIIGWALDLPLTSKPAHAVSGQATSTMSAEQTQATMEAYVAALLRGDDVEAFFADDIVVTFIGIGRVVKGRTRGKQAITRLLHGQVGAELEIGHLMVGPGRASHEGALIGAHLGGGVLADGDHLVEHIQFNHRPSRRSFCSPHQRLRNCSTS